MYCQPYEKLRFCKKPSMEIVGSWKDTYGTQVGVVRWLGLSDRIVERDYGGIVVSERSKGKRRPKSRCLRM
jgi:hypothetical protein